MLCSKRTMALLACAVLLAVSLCASASGETAACVDWAGSVHLDMQAEIARQEVTVKTYVDGDTTHFFVPETVEADGVLEARYLAVNTPESTGKIEEWGKAASRFTREKLENAEAILIESDSEKWNLDSTSARHLVWVWYRPAGETEYRNLNIELLQEGLALPNNAGGNRYGEACLAAVAQARANKLRIYSGEKDPDFFYGDAIELTIRELRLHPEEYEGKKVAFSGVVTVNHNNAVFIEDFDDETGLYFGITAYYGFNLSGGGLEVLHVGNEVRIVGTMQYYEAGHAWQVSGLNYRMMKPKDPGNIQKLSDGHSPAWTEITAEQFFSTVTIETESGPETYDFAYLAQGTSVQVRGVYAALSEEDTSGNTCRLISLDLNEGGLYDVLWIWINTDLLRSLDLREGSVYDVRGIVGCDAQNDYRICVYTKDGITIQE
ncbi:MAG: thermonuclease family protein [Clostridia bacterium]|nr:thermonuclease family protein [Clostridia bacterium]